jgi:superkiller protein 3
MTLYREMIAIAPEKPNGYALVGGLLFEEGRYEEALASFQQALQQSEQKPYWILAALGRSYAGLGRWAEAVEAYDQAIRTNPESPGPYALLGQAECQLGHPAEARLAYEHAIELGHQAENIRPAVEHIAQYGSCLETAAGKK